MKKKDYTHEDFEKEFLKTPAMRRAYERGVAGLLIAHKIADLRERHHMTQAELARRLHTRQQVVSRLEQDKYRPSLTTLEKIARVFGKRLEINFV
ncbi:MAG TPA: transcriptional regulator [Elusimicrobia bacterium]|jgi:DNA-binding XRE family transcriptional regulator|nr:MAG: helix-turn-helix domain-containing protein [Elusimicrobiota bacterium]KAF0153987.1 MAG: helix-turn-helix domain-containing protein [Elusimicrobiota bacterium]HBE87751.1 transcriptional regulator [Elusimicrobiota bacterium]